MYAKLVFPAGTDFNLVARDIVRAIVNSTGAGGSTVGALENVDAGNSTIDDTVAANWTLVSPVALPTGAVVASDMTMVLSQPHANGTTKHVGIGDFRANSVADAGTSTYAGTVLWPYSDYGTGSEQAWFRASNASILSTSVCHNCRVTGEEVHVIAKDKFIGIFGINTGYYPGWGGIAVVEPVDTYETRQNGGARAVQAMMTFRFTKSATLSAFSGTSATATLRDYTGTNPFSPNYAALNTLNVIDCVRAPRIAKWFRAVHVSPNSFASTPSADPSNADPSALYIYAGEYDDGTFNYSTVGDIEPVLFGWGSTQHGYGINAQQWDLRSGKMDKQMNAADTRDIAGNASMLLLPMYSAFGEDGYIQDYTTEAGLYGSVSLVDTPAQVLNDGTDDYFCFQTGAGSVTGPCVWVKLS